MFSLVIYSVDAYSELLKVMTAEQAESEAEAKIKSFHGFLTKEVAFKLIAKEKGLLKQEERTVRISEIKDEDRNITVIAKVEAILPEVTYPSGKKSRSIILKDETGTIHLKLWEENMGLCNSIRTGSELKITGAYEKFDSLNLGYSGTIEVVSSTSFTELNSLPSSGNIHISAMVSEVEGMKTGLFYFTISDGKGNEAKAVIREGIGRGTKLEAGDEVILDNANIADGRIFLLANSRLLVKKNKGVIQGKVESIEPERDGIAVIINDKRISMNRENALKFFGVDAADDISLNVLASLKRDSFIGKSVRLKVREENGRFIILN
jgi:hypothetical protein